MLSKFVYNKWKKGWLQKKRIMMPVREEIMLNTRHGGGNMRPVFSYRMKRRRLMILCKTRSLL